MLVNFCCTARMLRLPLLSTLLLGLAFFPTRLQADIIYLKDKTLVGGRIAYQTLDTVVLKTKKGNLSIRKKNISKIKFINDEEKEEVILELEKRKLHKLWLENLEKLLIKRRSEEKNQENAYTERKKEEIDFFYQEDFELKNRVQDNALRRSLFMPGWGQFYKKHNTRGYIASGGVLLSAGGIYYGYKEYRTNKKSYNDLNTMYMVFLFDRHNLLFSTWANSKGKEYRNNMDRGMKISVLSAGTMAAIYFFGLGDAYYTDPNLEPNKNKEKNSDTIDELTFRADKLIGYSSISLQPEYNIINLKYSLPVEFRL